MTILEVKSMGGDRIEVSYPAKHPKAEQIRKWLQRPLSPGYIEYLLQMGTDPHCNACRDHECENCGNGDDACPGFKYGDKW